MEINMFGMENLTAIIIYTDVDISGYKYKTKVLDDSEYEYPMYLNLPF